MNDITALPQRLKERAEQAKRLGAKNPRFTADEVLALVEALEKAQRANAAQDDHLNQQQDRIESLEKKNAELGKYAGEQEGYHSAFIEWHDKTEWVQTDKRFDVIKPLGKHRADVLREYIEHLESRTVTVKLTKRSVSEVMLLSGFDRQYAEGWCSGNDNAINEMKMAGILVIEGEGQ
ncbi:hypothetical protein ACGCE5_14825 [Kluyvera ascorbata]|uniref:hypothetical protein n=1 Tax=Kluyvera ascorbata TaxID=51288 RepID=UPI00374DE7D3